MGVGWVVAVAVVALVVGASAGALIAAVVIAAGRGQREGADAACSSCSAPFDLAPGRPVPASAPGPGSGAPADA